MRRLYILIICISTLGLLISEVGRQTITNTEVYIQHIRQAIHGPLDGPDKARFRDVIMTINPLTGQFNPKEKSIVWKNRAAFRSQESRNFQWEEVSSDVAGRIRSLMIDPNNSNKLWAGSVTGGLWFSNDFRSNTPWQNVSDQWINQSISCISYDPNNTSTFYVGTGESYTSVSIYRESTSAGAGIYKSIDAGASWTLMESTKDFDYVNDIVVRNEDGLSIIYAAVASGKYQGKIFNSTPSDGLYKSSDEGNTWTQVLPNISGSSVPYAVSDIELTESGRLFVGTMRNLELKGGGKILYSDDGLSWTEESAYVEDIIAEGVGYDLDMLPGRVMLASAPSNGNHVYAVATAGWINGLNQIRDHGFFTRIRQTTDHGLSWSYLDGPNSNWASIPWHALGLAVDPNNENKIVVGGLNAYSLSNADSGGTLNWVHLSDWSAMYHFSNYTRKLYYGGIDQAYSDSVINHFVHADIHAIQFVSGSSDEVLISTDGGVQFTGDMSKSDVLLSGERLNQYPIFIPINNSLTTTQYYTVAINPEKGNDLILAGAQDNSTHINEDIGNITYANMIGGGDGAYAFFDADDPQLRITSSQVNTYNFFYGDEIFYVDTTAGTFINPGAYDDRSNILYTNLASDGGFEALLSGVAGRYLDMVGMINVNEFLDKGKLGLETFEFLKLGTGSSSAFSAMKISPHDPSTNATMVLGNQFGDLYLVTGLPFAPVSKKIDRDMLPVGYISSVDIGDSNNDLLVTFSNYGLNSVWHTVNGGFTWVNLERNLPDIPVRHGLFNPYDDQQIIIATEVGVWGLEHIKDAGEQWQQYSQGFPNIRVDMLAIRKSDSTIVAATHGRGVFKGKFIQKEVQEDPLGVQPKREITIYPNPTKDMLKITPDEDIIHVKLIDISGRAVINEKYMGSHLNLSGIKRGLYILHILDKHGTSQSLKIQVL